MKRILSLILATMLMATAITFVMPAASAQTYMVANFPAYQYGKGTDQGGGTLASTLETVTLSGRNVLKITPYNSVADYPDATQISLNCYGLSINPADLVGANHVAIRYKYETSAANAEGYNMGIIMMPHSGGLSSWVKNSSSNTIVANEWTTIVIPIGNDFTSKLVTTGDKKITQFQIYLAGVDADAALAPAEMEGDAFYISDIEFWSGYPDMAEGPDYLVFDAANYFEAPAAAGSATCSKVVFDGRDAVKIEFNTDYEDKTTFYGWKFSEIYNGARRVDLQEYKYMAITYYLDGSFKNNTVARMRIGMPVQAGILSEYTVSYAPQRIYAQAWNISTFNLSGFNYESGYINTFARSIHFRPLGDNNNTTLNDGSAMYVSQIIFSKKPVNLITNAYGYLEGNGDGSFRPNDNLTRAEAAAISARLLAGSDSEVPTTNTTSYSDVASGSWYYKYVAYLENQGVLTDFSGTLFVPSRNITKGELSALLYRIGQKRGSLTVGELFGTPDDESEITRAEAVSLINATFGRTTTADDLNGAVQFLYTDVDASSWAFADICDATLDHIEETDTGKWVANHESEKSVLPEITQEQLEEGAAYVESVDALEEQRIAEIRSTATSVTATGTKYYVSSSQGNDNNSGTSESAPWKTLRKVSNTTFEAGDVVLFKRGDTWREEPENNTNGRLIATTDGVTYSAYGEGAKPQIFGSPENGADASKWTLVDGTTNIYRYETQMTDVGLVVMNPDSPDALWGYKQVPDLLYKNDSYNFYVRGTNGSTAFDIKTHLTHDLDFFCDIPTHSFRYTKGYLYMRSDKGNPGSRFASIEFAPHIHGIYGNNKNNLTFDNLCVKYVGAHGLGTGTCTGLTVKNCEFGWIGGSYQYYNGTSGAVRFGNGIEIYGQAQNYLVENNYIYQNYDAGATHQITGTNDTSDFIMKDIVYRNNVITDCIYNIEHFIIDDTNRIGKKWGENLLIENNILRRAGYGFGITRPNGNSGANIQGRSGSNLYKEGTYVVRNNIIDRSSNVLINCNSRYDYGLPVYEGNTWVNTIYRKIGHHNTEALIFDRDAALVIRDVLGDKSAKVYWLDESYAYSYRGVQY